MTTYPPIASGAACDMLQLAACGDLGELDIHRLIYEQVDRLGPSELGRPLAAADCCLLATLAQVTGERPTDLLAALTIPFAAADPTPDIGDDDLLANRGRRLELARTTLGVVAAIGRGDDEAYDTLVAGYDGDSHDLLAGLVAIGALVISLDAGHRCHTTAEFVDYVSGLLDHVRRVLTADRGPDAADQPSGAGRG